MPAQARDSPDAHDPSGHAPAPWTFVLGGVLVVGAATLAGILAGGPPTRQALAALAVAALAAVGAAVPLWRTRREVRHLRTLEQAAARFAAIINDDSPEAALEAAVQVLLPDARLVALHLGQRRPADLGGLAGVVVDDALATGLPAEVPDGTTGRETARLLALPLALRGERGAVLLWVPGVSSDEVADVQRLLARIAPGLAAPAPDSEDPTEPASPPPAAEGAGDDSRDSELREVVARGAHDLRTPLNTVTGMVDTLVRYGDRLSPSQREQLHEALQRSTRRIAGWIAAMLDAAAEQPSEPAHVGSCHLQPLLEEAVMVSNAATAGLEVYVAPTTLKVVADPGDVVRAVGNLLANAGHHAQSGDTVEVEARPRGDQVEICVRDHGDGWDGTDAPTVAATNGGGSHHAGLGLGLASVRSQVDSWGGELELGETPGGGATVCFTLPRAMGADLRREVEPEPGWTIAGGQSHVRGVRTSPRAGRGDSPGRRHG